MTRAAARTMRRRRVRRITVSAAAGIAFSSDRRKIACRQHERQQQPVQISQSNSVHRLGQTCATFFGKELLFQTNFVAVTSPLMSASSMSFRAESYGNNR